jgi:hypothetical protein
LLTGEVDFRPALAFRAAEDVFMAMAGERGSKERANRRAACAQGLPLTGITLEQADPD